MAGFGAALSGIGMGLGQFADYWQREQQIKQQNQTRLLDTLFKGLEIRKLLQDQQTQQSASDAAAAALLGGAGGMSGGIGGAPAVPPAPTIPVPGAGGGVSAPVPGTYSPGTASPDMPQTGMGLGGMPMPDLKAGGALTQPGGAGLIDQPSPGAPYTSIPGGGQGYATGISAPTAYRPMIEQDSRQYGVPDELLTRLLSAENDFKPTGVSKAGARGIAQFLPSTAREYGINPDDPKQAISGAAHYLADLHRQRGSWLGALTGYLGGDPRRDPSYTRKGVWQLAQALDRSGGGTPQRAPAEPAGQSPNAGAASGQPGPEQPAAANTTIPEPPQPFDPATVARTIKQQHPEFDNRTLMAAVEMVGTKLGPSYKAAYQRWKDMAEIHLRQSQQAQTARHQGVEEAQGGQRLGLETSGQAETKRYHDIEAGQAQQRIGLEGGAQAETKRYHDIEAGQAKQRIGLIGDSQAQTAKHETATETETHRANVAREQAASERLRASIGKQQQKTELATTELRTLAARARSLLDAVEKNPNLVGARGIIGRLGGITEQLGIGKGEDPHAAEFKSEVQLLQAQLQKPLLGSRYFSGKVAEQMRQLLPGLAALDNPTAVKASLSGLADTLEGNADMIESVSGGVTSDFSKMNDQEILNGLGIGQPQQ